ncbi:MAG: BON domain-containing protein [Candidatus Eremiobacteraeota bacterium]|nr:BON domain-containing protein [Candidatus Eremiobacteraeota bacterium]
MQTKTLDLQEEILEQLAFDPRVSSDDIAVTVQEGVVTLRGTVPSFHEKWEAEDVVKRVRGVRGLVDEMAIDLPALHVRNDTDIALALQHRFDSSTVIPSTITFDVNRGHVTMSGEVAWHYQATEAVNEAKAVVGVKDIVNLIRVKPAKSPSADEIVKRIHGALARTADLEAQRIHVTVAGSLVTLSGSVRSWFERDNAGQAAWSIPGVTHVDNRIAVNAW